MHAHLPSTLRNLLLISALALSASACLYRQPIYQGNLLEKTNVDQLAAGQSKQQVMALLGTPSVEDPFHAQRWDYIASERIGHHKTQVKDLTVYFDNDTVARWEGDYFPEQDLQLAGKTIRFWGRNLAKDKKKKGGE